MNRNSFKDTAKKSLTDFVQLEDGKLGKQDALMLGSVFGASVLGQVLLSILEDNNAESTDGGYSRTECGGVHDQASF